MKYTILGFNQTKLIEFGLDTIDAMLLRYFVDFKGSGHMHTETFEGEIYYWLKYKNIILELPLLNLKKDSIYKRLKNMTECNILQHITIKNKGVYSYYRLGANYLSLVSSTDLNPNPYGYKSTPPADTNPYPSGFKSDTPTDENPEQNINLLKDSSTKDSSTKKTIYVEVVDYLNQKCGTSYKSTTKKTQQLIRTRVKEGFTLEDFYKVIDNKAKQWLKTEREQYLRPVTLFGTNFESYLNQNNRREKENADNEKDSGKITESEFGFSL